MPKFLTLVVLLQASATSGQPVDRCPALPPDSGYSWTYRQGPDFGVCYAVDTATKKDAFGIYLGFAPSFHPESAGAVDRGSVGGYKVEWYGRAPSDDASKFSRETLIKLDRQGSAAHVWITASSGQELEQRLKTLSNLRFK